MRWISFTTAAASATAGAVVVLALAGCAGGASSGSVPDENDGDAVSLPTPTTTTEVIGQGTVLQNGTEDPRFCLGAIAESYPPQCSGPPIRGWDWAGVELSETSENVTWGSFAVQGTWDGEAFTVTQPPIPLALYDPMAVFDPRTDPNNPGTGDEGELLRVQDELQALGHPSVLSTSTVNGYLFVDVIFDDGKVQAALDGQYGPNLIAVVSALKPVG